MTRRAGGGRARVLAQAKINLRLRVLAREASGYHTLETIFCRLDLADEVVVRAGDGVAGRTLDCAGGALPAAGLGDTARNLAYRAATAYAEAAGWPGAFAIELTKRIPVGGGLGGGSADAGAVLRALEALSPAPLGPRLVEVGATLGADVPFLTIDSPMALGWSRGERLLPLPVPAPRVVVLALPGFGVATPEAFAWLASSRGAGYAPRGLVLAPSDLDTWDGLASIAENDFDEVVGRAHPEVPACVAALRAAGAAPALMSGSGSSVFGVFADGSAAMTGARAVEALGATAVTTRTASRVAPVEVAAGS